MAQKYIVQLVDDLTQQPIDDGEGESVRFALDGVSYTTCPEGSGDWQLLADRVSIDTARSMGTARDARVEFFGVPLLRLPVISFPVGNARKTGVLTWERGQRSGRDIEA